MPLKFVRENTQHSQETGVHAPCGIRTRNPSKTTPGHRLRSHWDRPLL